MDVLALAGFALPSFWLALVLVTVFAVLVRIFPATGYVPPEVSPGQWLRCLVLPMTALAVHGIAVIAK
ncbi:ABC transporter permease family protein [Streptantibioticus cattleyicolor]|uniref:Binding-protein-dependent transport systems inner membrane component n=1 Tax=Streptantibioticus cattleyicolor (strain ATCC 35852 / DSM 46488 / JCM 4925 / NBRC 14057 / NRRL 8057) TaxID=1003195 RepID=G8XHK1_STREN|nr:binding-protein-dependent transport systems inner membrane component [Streptantibioticus cattleyicolor]AEW99838.1 binding-protein-dependent transport systems inner membrane component [Streptantibioticus cattleyicolor NRRL 8057 = DSM 46488]